MDAPRDSRSTGEKFDLDVKRDVQEDVTTIPGQIAREHAKTANAVAILLVGAVVVSLPLHLLAIWFIPGSGTDAVAKAFEKWYALVSPLAGAAVGAYYALRKGS